MKQTVRITLAGIFGALSVMMGAFGAHALKPLLTAANQYETYQTASTYMMYHALAILITAALPEHGMLRIVGWIFTFGILFFSGSLYLICFTGVKAWGMVAPIGGLCFIVGWLGLLVYGSKLLKYKHH